MHRLFLIILLSTCFSSMAMDLLIPGQIVNWHKRDYKVTDKFEQDGQVTIIMARPTHSLGNIALRMEYITRIYRDANNDPESTTGTCTLTPIGQKALITTALLFGVCLPYIFIAK